MKTLNVIILLWVGFIESSIIHFEVFRREEKYSSFPYINLCFGYPLQCLRTVIDITSKNICLKTSDKSINGYDINSSKSKHIDTDFSYVYLWDVSLVGCTLFENVHPEYNEKMNILLIKASLSNDYNFDNLLGMQMKSTKKENDDYLYVEYLYKNKKIDKKIFVLTYDKLYIGGVPEFVSDKGIIKTCQCSKNYNLWNCQLLNVEIGNSLIGMELVDTMQILKFYTRRNGITATGEYGRIIHENLMKIHAFKTKCKQKERSVISDPIILECDSSILDDKEIPEIKLILMNGIKISIPKNKMFSCDKEESKCDFIISYAIRGLSWDIGNDVIENQVIIFDMENSEIGFVEMREGVTKIGESKKIRSLYITVIIIALVSSIVLVYGKKYRII